MKNFFYKLVLTIISVVIVYKFTVGEQINTIINKVDLFSTKEGRIESISKIKNDLKKAEN